MPDRRAAQRAASFQCLFGGTPDGMALLDSSGAILAANPALERLAGGEALRGLPATRLLAPADRPALAALLAGSGQRDLRARPAGSGLGAWSLTSELLAGGGRLLRVLDHGEGDRAEVPAVNASRLEMLGRLTGGIVHDVNNLLGIIRGAAEAVRTLGLPPAGEAEVKGIEDAARRGAVLIAELLALVRPQKAAPCSIVLDAAIEALAPLLRRLVGKAVRLELLPGAAGLAVRLGPEQLDRLLMNLAVNAGEAMAEGGCLTIATRQAPGEAVLEVRDTGCGIPPEALPHIFDPFFTTRATEGGTGLGLATVRDIVGAAGGRVVVESRRGQGTCFRIHLPRLEAPVEAAPRPAPTGEAGPILLVEDEAVLRRLAEHVLSRQGQVPLLAESAEAALDLLERSPPPGLLVSDISLPGMDGRELARRLRLRWPHLPVVLASGYGSAGLRAELAAEGFHLLAKPYGSAELMAALEAVRRVPVTV
ncbi:hybrid sensor histidine kinase/response regulator [Belnapia rosea]|uniref:histidine kinase n=1 Tax=Belnapia rosea TaxID=938405 RepID=A0A1G6PD96_9PROT|nr:PAS domain-containing sensor histidine kinase [Belnapia rosea]SDC78220.1 Signal transduction histidine kinase [Belnapia rosea]